MLEMSFTFISFYDVVKQHFQACCDFASMEIVKRARLAAKKLLRIFILILYVRDGVSTFCGKTNRVSRKCEQH